MLQGHRNRSGEPFPKYCRLPKRLPGSGSAKRVQKRGTQVLEADRVETFGEETQPTKLHAFGSAVQQVRRIVDLERQPLRARRTTKMVKIPKEILRLEPNSG